MIDDPSFCSQDSASSKSLAFMAAAIKVLKVTMVGSKPGRPRPSKDLPNWLGIRSNKNDQKVSCKLGVPSLFWSLDPKKLFTKSLQLIEFHWKHN